MANMFRASENKNAVEGKSRNETKSEAVVQETKVEVEKKTPKTETTKKAPKAETAKKEPKSTVKYDINEILQTQKKQPGKTCSFYLDINIIEEIDKLAEKNKMKKSEVVNEILKKVLIG